ncbi:MAG: CRISPR-associated endonuclease/helicase Cas3 [Rickettsiales bacterium]|jgi:CRISPR-associated endonuclease/helicase Cas3
MMVTFVSQCEKKALSRTRRVLDAFANRIGDNTWQTVITEDGLITVKKLLRQSATKNTAVSCHWLRSRSRSELVWIVGNRDKFNSQGIVPVNLTQKNLMKSQWENDWHYLPEIKALTAISALLHDWGKASLLFQKKLKNKDKISDPLRHEWVSCLLLNALVRQSGNDDEGWLKLLVECKLDERKLKTLAKENISNPLDNLPPIAQLVSWLIVTHHRLPFLGDDNQRSRYADERKDSISEMLKSITSNWGYQNYSQEQLDNCFKFPKGLLGSSKVWVKEVKKWSAKLLQAKPQIHQLIDNGAYRLLLHHSRLCLMLGDHYYSSCEADKKWADNIDLYANTDNGILKQKLDEHLVKVSHHALIISQTLSSFSNQMNKAYDIKSLKKKSPKGFEWQDRATQKIDDFKRRNPDHKNFGYFVVNIASTGCGKTIANAKIMRSLSEDGESLRYILALGLRTLTMQTGDEYRNNIGLKNDELAVLIGSAAIKELHEENNISEEKRKTFEEGGSESLENLLEEDLDFEDSPTADFLDAVIPEHNSKKLKAFLYAPVLACTIDHIIASTEKIRGGKYILPCLRMLSSDLVIDEIDDFDSKDLVAIGRLIHLAGMLGRKVMISSATIPPALAEGFFNSYQEGWRIHSNFKQTKQNIVCAWVDEFDTDIDLIDKKDSISRCQSYQDFHKKFITKRITKIEKQIVRRKGFIVKIDELLTEKTDQKKKYFEKIKQTAIDLHKKHHIIDKITKKKVSFGVVRVANIAPSIDLSEHLLQANWEEGFAPKIMTYHSRQVLLLRHEQEKHLDKVLKRKQKPEEEPQAFNNSIIRAHLDSTAQQNVIFILVATPVEEVGRDHDFDWAIVEPSSYRSIIQLSGRVRRHRKTAVNFPNVAIMQFNLKGLKQDKKPAFTHPGYETKSLSLNSHNLCQIADESILNNSIDAIPRIYQPKTLNHKDNLSDLEHQTMSNILTNYYQSGPKYLQSWLTESWWLTALPQQFNRFRESAPEIKLYLVWKDRKTKFYEKGERGEFLLCQEKYDIEKFKFDENLLNKLWLKRDYENILKKRIGEEQIELDGEKNLNEESKKYGEINIPDRDGEKYFYNDQFGLWKR